LIKTTEDIEDLEKTIDSVLLSIGKGLKNKNCRLMGVVEFELAVIRKGDMKGGFRLILADATGKYSKESVSRIKFHVVGKRGLQKDWIPEIETSKDKIVSALKDSS
jgi:hypothetical protein